MVVSKRWRDRLFEWIIVALLMALAITTLLPIVNTLAISLSAKSAVSGGMVKLWPIGFNLYSYEYIVQDGSFWRAFGVSLQRVALGGFLNIVLAILTAFPLSRSAKAFPGRSIFMWLLVVGMILNVGLVPWYLTISNYGPVCHNG